jgi:hypothetical protein
MTRYAIRGALGSDTVKYSTAGKDIRQFFCAEGQRNLVVNPESEPDVSLDGYIVLVLHNEPFLSLR